MEEKRSYLVRCLLTHCLCVLWSSQSESLQFFRDNGLLLTPITQNPGMQLLIPDHMTIRYMTNSEDPQYYFTTALHTKISL